MATYITFLCENVEENYSFQSKYSGWGKSQPSLFTPEKLDMFDPIYCFKQVFWLNIRPPISTFLIGFFLVKN